MSDVKQKLLDQATELARTIDEYVDDAIDNQDIDNKVEEALGNVDFDEKVQDALDNNHRIVDEDKAMEIAHDAIGDTDWYTIMSDNDIATTDWVDERIQEEVDAKLFTFLQDVTQKCFEHDHQAWMDAIRQQGVTQYLTQKKKEEEEAKKEESTEEKEVESNIVE